MPGDIDSAADTRIRKLPVDLIRPGTYQARRLFSKTALMELAQSVAESGVIQPVVVRSSGGGYLLLAGERRWHAAQLAGLHELPALIRDDLSDGEAAVLGLIENLQRESLAPMETARGLDRLLQEQGLTHDALAGRIGKSRAYVSNYLRLLHLDPGVQRRVDAGELSLGHAKVLAGMPQAEQGGFAHVAVRRRLSVRGLEHAWRRRQDRPVLAAADGDAGMRGELAALERGLAEHLGNAVRIYYDPDSRAGEIRVSFHDLEEFEGLLQRWGYPRET